MLEFFISISIVFLIFSITIIIVLKKENDRSNKKYHFIFDELEKTKHQFLIVECERNNAIRELDNTTTNYKELQSGYSTLLNQKKSSEVRLGKIGENLAPFLTDWPFDPNNFRFIGDPIDGIQFTDDGIYIVEIKTGNAKLSQGQKKCKKLIETGKVYFMSFRVGDNGVKITTTSMAEDLENGVERKNEE